MSLRKLRVEFFGDNIKMLILRQRPDTLDDLHAFLVAKIPALAQADRIHDLVLFHLDSRSNVPLHIASDADLLPMWEDVCPTLLVDLAEKGSQARYRSPSASHSDPYSAQDAYLSPASSPSAARAADQSTPSRSDAASGLGPALSRELSGQSGTSGSSGATAFIPPNPPSSSPPQSAARSSSYNKGPQSPKSTNLSPIQLESPRTSTSTDPYAPSATASRLGPHDPLAPVPLSRASSYGETHAPSSTSSRPPAPLPRHSSTHSRDEHYPPPRRSNSSPAPPGSPAPSGGTSGTGDSRGPEAIALQLGGTRHVFPLQWHNSSSNRPEMAPELVMGLLGKPEWSEQRASPYGLEKYEEKSLTITYCPRRTGLSGMFSSKAKCYFTFMFDDVYLFRSALVHFPHKVDHLHFKEFRSHFIKPLSAGRGNDMNGRTATDWTCISGPKELLVEADPSKQGLYHLLYIVKDAAASGLSDDCRGRLQTWLKSAFLGGPWAAEMARKGIVLASGWV